MPKNKWYYKMQEKLDGSVFFVSSDVPIKPERLCEVLGVEDMAVCLGEITKSEYENG